jgi:hypothetical protein
MVFRFLKFALFLLFIAFSCAGLAQDAVNPNQPWAGFGTEVNVFAGKVFKHEAKFRLPIPALSMGVDVDFLLHTYGKKTWEQYRKYPTIGLGITYTNYGIDSIYGQCVGIYPNLTIPIIRGKNIEWTLRLGDGIGYVTKHFRRVKPIDTINGAIGSNVNDFAYFSTDLRYHINNHWDVQVGGNFTHISDASFAKPNLGVNLYAAHVGLAYYPVTSRPARIARERVHLKNRYLAQARLGMAFVSNEAPGGPRYPVYLTSAYVSRRWKNVNKMFAGIDYSYHSEIYAFLRNNEIFPGTEMQHSWKSAAFFGNEFLIGRVGVILQIGIYIKEAELRQDPFYEKVGGHYYFVQKEKGPVKEFFFMAYLKTHRTVAELGEFGIGFGF